MEQRRPPAHAHQHPALSAYANPCDAGVVRSQRASVGKPCTHSRAALAATILSSSMAFIDASVVNIALPSIQRELAVSVAAMQWIVDAYLLLLGSLVLIGGALGDKLGRRTIFVVGVAIFTGASAACGLAPNAAMLIAARAVQGVGAALLVPSSLAIIGAVFAERDRGRAIGTWAGFGAITSAIGPVIGGWLVDALSWRAIFFINLPVALAALALAVYAVPNSRAPATAGALDWIGALMAVGGLGGLTYGLTIASTMGLAHADVLVLVGIGTVLLTAFVFVEARARNPMMPLSVFCSRDFTGANIVTLLVYFGLGGALFFLPYTLIRAHGYTATAAGAALLPLSVTIGALSSVAGSVAERIGPRVPLIAGPIVAGIGFAMLGGLVASGSFWRGIFPALTVVGLGMTITVAPLTTTVMAAVSDQRAGVASGINNAVARVAGLLAIAVLGIVFVHAHDLALSAQLDRLNVPLEQRQSLQPLTPAAAPGPPNGGAGGSRGARDTHAASEPSAADAARTHALTAAMRAVALVCAACAIAGAGCAALTIRQRIR